jgi:tRNA (cytidine32/uridine32-2'-O)-methyltransferase
MLNKIKIILINTSHPGNIGAAARAMKTMGLLDLTLVNPLQFPDPKAAEMASNAGDVLVNASVVHSLAEAVADCHLVVGTSTRHRTIPWPLLAPREFAEQARKEVTRGKVAVIFGREQSGLSNEELHMCHFHIQIPANPDYGSLNLASAVQVIAYELRLASLVQGTETESWDYPLANAAQVELFYDHLEKLLIQSQFLNPKAPRQLMARLRRLFNRTRLDEMEVNILRGILTAVEKKQ